ncbi:AIPR family protein [Streptomyces eurythermus]|uniref:AIPR family protein n=1 Tax=Streptomyces eurythermus TaxID=42237 RepID=UPI00340A247E
MDDVTGLPGEVRYVSDHLRRAFEPLIDMGDFAHRDAYLRDAVFLTRALAAQAVCVITGRSPEEAAASVTDGIDDQGIDAIAISPSGSDIWFVQAKWSPTGRAVFKEADALRLVLGLRRLAHRHYEGANPRINRLLDRIDEALSSPRCTVHLVAALAGDGRVASQAERRLAQVGEEFGFGSRTAVKVRSLGLADFHSAARLQEAPVPVEVTASLTQGWHSVQTPYPAYMGLVPALEIASWYESHGLRLVEQRLRDTVQADRLEREAAHRLVSDPEQFWYLSNGLTLVCDAVRTEYFGRRMQGEPVRLRLSNAQAVDGTWLLSALAQAADLDLEAVERALVPLRVICVADAPESLVSQLTVSSLTANRPNVLERVASDPQQALIRDEFADVLGKQYVFKEGALPPAPSAGCTVQEAAMALACSHSDVTLVARAGADSEYLFLPSPRGAYTRLFGQAPPARHIWVAVLLHRLVRSTLAELAPTQSSWVRDVMEHGELLLSHLAFRHIGTDNAAGWVQTAEEDAGWARAWIQDSASSLASAVADLYGKNVFLASILTDPERCRRLAAAVSRTLSSGAVSRARPQGQSARRPASVSLLVDHGRIPDGTRLVYRPSNPTEEEAIGDWLREDPRRYLATWVNDRRKPLVWVADGRAYSPTGLITHIWQQADWREAPLAVRGPAGWHVPGEGTLVELADQLVPGTEPDGGA